MKAMRLLFIASLASAVSFASVKSNKEIVDPASIEVREADAKTEAVVDEGSDSKASEQSADELTLAPADPDQPVIYCSTFFGGTNGGCPRSSIGCSGAFFGQCLYNTEVSTVER